MRCSMFTVSKYAYEKKKKLCPNVASMKLCIPYGNVQAGQPVIDGAEISHGQATVIGFGPCCAFHGSLVRGLKTQTVRTLISKERADIPHFDVPDSLTTDE